MGFWKKRINMSSKKMADELGVEPEKIKELKNGEREIGGKTMDKVLEVINKKNNKETITEENIRKAEIFKWIISTDLNVMMRAFGYKNQKEIAQAMGIAQSSFAIIAAKKVKKCTTNCEIVYNFFQNDFNKKINKKSVAVKPTKTAQIQRKEDETIKYTAIDEQQENERKNALRHINDILLKELDALSNENDERTLDIKIRKAKAVGQLSQTIINNANTCLKAAQYLSSDKEQNKDTLTKLGLYED